MRATFLRVIVVVSLLAATALIGASGASSDSPALSSRLREQHAANSNRAAQKNRAADAPMLSYRSPGAMHKVMLKTGDAKLLSKLTARGAARRVRKYPSYTLLEVSDQTLASLDSAELERAELRDDLNLVMLRRGQIDTAGPMPEITGELRQPEGLRAALHLVQLFGSPTPETFRALKATGAKVVSYIPNNTYLVWAKATELQRIGALQSKSDIIQWQSPLHPLYKLDPRIKLDSVEQIPVTIEVVDADSAQRALAQIRAIARQVLMEEFKTQNTLQIKILTESFNLAEVARIPEVVAVEPWARPRMLDERANQIIAGALSEETVNSIKVIKPSRPGFLAFLNSLGFNSDMDVIVDVGDSGLDRGSADPATLHADFLDGAGQSRIAYLNDFSSDHRFHAPGSGVFAAHDSFGHGTINASIIGGLNTQTGAQFTDALGFQYGLGVAPFVRIGATKLFDDVGDFSTTPYSQIVLAAYRGGARITSNSWGTCSLISGFCNLYTADSHAYDFFVRDADFETPGNQSITAIFSAGNEGEDVPNSINMPATAKNVITVGASEGFRSTDADGKGLTDGCNIGPTSSDNAFDITGFSSGGRVQDGRAKPDLVAPGTHIVGAAPQDPFFAARKDDELGVCDKYFPFDQTLYTWSSGTSHSTPVVAGGAALAFNWLRERLSAEPSPALLKAFMLNSTSYLAGRLGGDSLPGKHQGWGILNLARMFEQTDRVLLEQDPARTFTSSGGAPYTLTGVITDPSKEFRVMLVWTDPPGAPNSNAPYINQLNLEVTVNGVTYNGNNFSGQYSVAGGQRDFLNNVQGVRLPAGVTGSFVIRIHPTIIAGDGVPGNGADLDQDFALVVTNGRQAAVPVLNIIEGDGVSQGVTVAHPNGSTDESLTPGETALVSLHVANDSQTTAAAITAATLTGPGGAFSTSTFPVIEPGRSAVNSLPFNIAVPSNLRCGSAAEFQLRLATEFGETVLPVRIRVGRASAPASEIIADDVDSARVKWKLKKGFVVAANVGNSGSRSYHIVDPGNEDDDRLLATMTLKKKITLPENAGNIRLSFFHIFNFEPGFDGGVAEISTDGGQTWVDLGSRVIVGGYDGHVTEASENPLGNRFAWTSRGRPGVFSQVVINLDDFAGERIRLRFVAGFDINTGVNQGFSGWFIDDIKITASSFSCK